MMAAIRFPIFLFTLLTLFASSSAADCAATAAKIIFQPNESALLGVVIMLILLVIIIAYVLGQLTANPNFTVFAKDEAYHFAISILMIACFGLLFMFSCTAVDMFQNTILGTLTTENELPCYNPIIPDQDMISVSICFLHIAKDDARRISEVYIDRYIKELRDSTWTTSIHMPLTSSYSISGGAYKRVVASQYDNALNMFVFPALVSLSMQELFLTFISSNVLTWILPTALILRVFIPTRQMGNILIALAVGLYLIIPFMYTYNLAMYSSVGYDECEMFRSIITDKWFGDCYSTGNFWYVARLIPQAFFLPNLTIALFLTYLAGANKALRAIG